MALLNVLKRWETALAAAACLALAVAVTLPALLHISWWGAHDWVQFYTYYGVPHRAVAEFGELPGWNPYFYGGNVQWGHPDDPTLSPIFIPTLLFGVVAGTKVDIVLMLFGGMLSMWLLARHVGLSPVAAAFAGAVWGLNGWHGYHFAVGHCDHFTFLFQPLAVYFVLRGCDDLRFSVGAGAVLALMYLSGGPYPFVFTGLLVGAVAFVESARRNNVRPLGAAAAAFGAALCLAFVKLAPTLIFSAYSEAVPEDTTGTGIAVVWRALFDARLPMLDEGKYVANRYGAWEYAAFIGYLPAAACAIGAAFDFRKVWGWLLVGAAFLVASFGSASPVNFFALFSAFPGLSGMHVPFRFVIHFIFALALAGGAGIDAIAKIASDRGLRRLGIGLAVCVVVVSTGNLVWMHYNRPVSLYRLAAYFVPPKKYGGQMPEKPPFAELAPGDEVFVPRTYDQALQVYVSFLDSRRLAWGYDATRLPNKAKFPGDEGYRGEVYFDGDSSGEARVLSSTLSRYAVRYSSEGGGAMVLNQNYAPGWTAEGAKGRVYSRGGLVAADVEAGSSEVVFEYRAPWRLPAAIVTLAAGAAALAFTRWGRRAK